MAKAETHRLTFEPVSVGKAEAEKLLGANLHNRKLRGSRVNKYAIDMLNGNWLVTGETIKISNTGVLLDGQHRLAAVIAASTEGALQGKNRIEAQPNLTVPMVIVRGLDDRAQEAMDANALRSLADQLELNRDERNSNVLSTTIRTVYAWDAGARKTIAKRDTVTNATLLAYFDANADMFRELVRSVINEYGKGEHLLPPSILALTHYIFEGIDAEDADVFFARLNDGQNLAKGNAIYELREALRRVRSERGHRAMGYILALTIKAWNAYRMNENINILTFKMGGAHPETFPEPL